MKNKTLLLTGVILKNGEGFGIRGSKNILSKLMLIFLFICIGPGMAAMLASYLVKAYDVLFKIQQQGIIISWMIAVNSMIIFIFGLLYIISAFYMSNDIENFLHLPLRPKQIIGAKFLAVTVYEYFITAIIFLPALLVYGIKSGSGPVYYLFGLIVFALIPVLPLAISSIIVMIIMRFLNISRHKDALKLIGGIIAIAFGIGINILINRFVIGASEGNLEELLMKGNNSLTAITSSLFPTAKWASDAILHSQKMLGFSSLLLYMIITIAIYICLIFLAELIYFKGVKGISESSSGRNIKKHADYNNALAKSTALKRLTITEIKYLFRTPIYFLNCVLINFIWPLFMFIPSLTSPGNADIIGQFSQLVRNAENPVKVFAGIFAALFFVGGTNGIAATAVSREGDELFVKKYLPVSYKKQIAAKVLSSVIIGLTSVFIFIVFAVAILKLPVYLGLIVLVMGWVPILLTSYIGIFIDIFNPKLAWDNEQKAVKQNINVIYSMAISIGFGALTVFIGFNIKLNIYLSALIFFASYLAIILIFRKLLYTIGVKRFCSLEN